jgi:polysaccharide chain length determinant protein (PEP-CTERM system associated)
LDDQIKKYEAQLRDSEKRRAAFYQQYADVLPDIAAGGNRLEAARAAVRQVQLRLNDAVARRDSLKKQLASVPAMLHVDQTAPVIIQNGAAAALSPEALLQQAKLRLQALLLQDTEQHPDVIATRHEIAALEAQIESEKKGAANGRPSGDGSAHATESNPLYEQLKLRLADAEGTVASLREQLQNAEAEKTRLEAIVQKVPDIELKAQNLDRDYSILKKNYEELVSRKESAQIGEAADTQADRIQFRVVDAPQVPLNPAAPNRPIFFSAVLALAAAAGIGVAFLLTQLDRSFSSLSALRSLALPILGAVSTFEPIESRRRRARQIAAFGASVLLLLIVYGALMATSLFLYQGVV